MQERSGLGAQVPRSRSSRCGCTRRQGCRFRLVSRQYVDFVDRDVGLARLRLFLAETDSPVGVLRELRYRLADAEREFPRAADDAQRRRSSRT